MRKNGVSPLKSAATRTAYGLAARGIPATQYTPLSKWVAVSLLTMRQVTGRR